MTDPVPNLDAIEKLLPDLWGSPHYDAMKTLIEQVRKLTQQVNAAADEVGAAREAWAKYQGEYLLREQAEQRVKELEQQLELRRVATDMDYETACNIQQQLDAYRKVAQQYRRLRRARMPLQSPDWSDVDRTLDALEKK